MADDATTPIVAGALEAPIIAFDSAPLFGTIPGIGRITLTTMVLAHDANGQPVEQHVAVAHLRGNAAALEALQAALEGIKLMAAGSAKPEGPVN